MQKFEFDSLRSAYRATRRVHRICGRAANEPTAASLLAHLDPRLARLIENAPSYYPADRIEARIESARSEIREWLRLYFTQQPIRRAGFDLRLTASYRESTPRVLILRDLRVMHAEIEALLYGPQRGRTIRCESSGDWRKDVAALADDLDAIRAMRGQKVAA